MNLRFITSFMLFAGCMQASTVTATGPVFGAGTGNVSSSVINSPYGQGVKFYGLTNPSCDSTLCTLQLDFNVANDGGLLAQLAFSVIIRSDGPGTIDWSFSNGAGTTYASGSNTGFPFAFVPNGSAIVNTGLVRFLVTAPASASVVRVSIPQDSIDFTPLPDVVSSTPEPSTACLVAVGVLLAAAGASGRRETRRL